MKISTSANRTNKIEIKHFQNNRQQQNKLSTELSISIPIKPGLTFNNTYNCRKKHYKKT